MPDPGPPEDKISAREFTDLELMTAIAGRDRTAFRTLFERYGPKVRSYHLGLSASPAQADDLLQEVMLTIWRKAGMYDGAKAAVSTWIFTMARNKYIDRVRKESRTEVLMDTDPERPSDDVAPDDAVNLGQETANLQAAMATLPEDQGVVIRMAFLKEMSHSQIAEELDLPLGTVKSRIRLAISRLRDRMEDVRRDVMENES